MRNHSRAGKLFQHASHIRFVRNYHEKIERVAAVTDNGFLAILPKVADHFVAAEVRHFDYQDRDEALSWLRTGSGSEYARNSYLNRATPSGIATLELKHSSRQMTLPPALWVSSALEVITGEAIVGCRWADWSQVALTG
jgi:hypothetical protein